METVTRFHTRRQNGFGVHMAWQCPVLGEIVAPYTTTLLGAMSTDLSLWDSTAFQVMSKTILHNMGQNGELHEPLWILFQDGNPSQPLLLDDATPLDKACAGNCFWGRYPVKGRARDQDGRP
jgi:hypothetical protein